MKEYVAIPDKGSISYVINEEQRCNDWLRQCKSRIREGNILKLRSSACIMDYSQHESGACSSGAEIIDHIEENLTDYL